MHQGDHSPFPIKILDKYLAKWQKTVNTLAKIADVPVALIMKYEEPYLQVFVSSKTDEDNPYTPGEKEIQTGLYCETVISDQKMLDIPNALEDTNWDNNPDLELGMLNYLGIPINWPDGTPFGTICVLDRKERQYSTDLKELLLEFGQLIENYLEILYDQNIIQEQGDLIEKLTDFLPICAYCKRVRNDEKDKWIDIEEYLSNTYSQDMTHGICDVCQSNLEYNI